MTVYDVAIVPAITGLVSIATDLGLPKKIAPVLSVVLGICAGIAYVAPDNLAEGTLVGLSLGLTAVGLYSGPKNVAEHFKK